VQAHSGLATVGIDGCGTGTIDDLAQTEFGADGLTLRIDFEFSCGSHLRARAFPEPKGRERRRGPTLVDP
jgi:hypothetical protein